MRLPPINVAPTQRARQSARVEQTRFEVVHPTPRAADSVGIERANLPPDALTGHERPTGIGDLTRVRRRRASAVPEVRRFLGQQFGTARGEDVIARLNFRGPFVVEPPRQTRPRLIDAERILQILASQPFRRARHERLPLIPIVVVCQKPSVSTCARFAAPCDSSAFEPRPCRRVRRRAGARAQSIRVPRQTDARLRVESIAMPRTRHHTVDRRFERTELMRAARDVREQLPVHSRDDVRATAELDPQWQRERVESTEALGFAGAFWVDAAVQLRCRSTIIATSSSYSRS